MRAVQIDMFSQAMSEGPETIEITRPHKWAHGATVQLALVSIELVPHEGRWMWSASLNSRNSAGQGYRALARWGRFADSKPAALLNAIDEVRAFMHRATDDEKKRISDWIATLASSAIATRA